MEIAEEFQRVDPGFQLAGFVAEQGGTSTGEREKFPGAYGPGQLECCSRWLLGVGRKCEKEEREK